MSNPYDRFHDSLHDLVETGDIVRGIHHTEPGTRDAYREMARRAHLLMITRTPELAPYLRAPSVTHGMSVIAHYIHMGALRGREEGLDLETTASHLQNPDSFTPLGQIAEQPLAVARSIEHAYGIKADIQFDADAIVQNYYRLDDGAVQLRDFAGMQRDARLQAAYEGRDLEGRGCPAQVRGILKGVHLMLAQLVEIDPHLLQATLEQTDS